MKIKPFQLFMIFVILLSSNIQAQNLLIKGIVLDETSYKPLPATSVSLDKKNIAFTDSNGFFLSVPNQVNILLRLVELDTETLNILLMSNYRVSGKFKFCWFHS